MIIYHYVITTSTLSRLRERGFEAQMRRAQVKKNREEVEGAFRRS